MKDMKLVNYVQRDAALKLAEALIDNHSAYLKKIEFIP